MIYHIGNPPHVFSPAPLNAPPIVKSKVSFRPDLNSGYKKQVASRILPGKVVCKGLSNRPFQASGSQPRQPGRLVSRRRTAREGGEDRQSGGGLPQSSQVLHVLLPPWPTDWSCMHGASTYLEFGMGMRCATSTYQSTVVYTPFYVHTVGLSLLPRGYCIS